MEFYGAGVGVWSGIGGGRLGKRVVIWVITGEERFVVVAVVFFVEVLIVCGFGRSFKAF